MQLILLNTAINYRRSNNSVTYRCNCINNRQRKENKTRVVQNFPRGIFTDCDVIADFPLWRDASSGPIFSVAVTYIEHSVVSFISSSLGYVESTCEWNRLLLIKNTSTLHRNVELKTARIFFFSCRSFLKNKLLHAWI
jgi:hypothetical protein